MSKNITIDQFQDYMLELFVKYGEEVGEVVVKCTNNLSNKVKPEIQGYSRQGSQLYKTGAYRRGWGVKTIKKPNIYQVKTYNRKKPTLVHLLEFGHRIGNSNFRARAFPHVQKTELKYLGLLQEKLESEIEKI